ncbi:MAG: transporter substrate-binding domain-containing protein [Chloroflexi bacterium]|nr:transporter substrate-binding domain-containing protein [Chloroflexota bacterium]
MRLIAVACLFALVACGAPAPRPAPSPSAGASAVPPGSYVATLHSRGKIRAGIREDSAPLASRDASGRFTGFEAEVAREIALAVFPTAASADSVIDWVPVTAAGRVSALESGAVDVVVAAIAITADRRSEIGLSERYLRGGQRLLVRRAETAIRGAGDLDGKTACVARGAPSGATLQRANPGVRLLALDDLAPCVQALAQGAADAVSGDELALVALALRTADTKLVGTPLTDEAYGVGVRRTGRDGLIELVDARIAAMIREGRWATLHARWIGQVTGEVKRTPDDRPAP